MPAALSIEKREEIVQRRMKGELFTLIAEEMSISYSTVRAIWHHWKQEGKL